MLSGRHEQLFPKGQPVATCLGKDMHNFSEEDLNDSTILNFEP